MFHHDSRFGDGDLGISKSIYICNSLLRFPQGCFLLSFDRCEVWTYDIRLINNECAECMLPPKHIRNRFTRLHLSKGENGTRNRDKSCKRKREFAWYCPGCAEYAQVNLYSLVFKIISAINKSKYELLMLFQVSCCDRKIRCGTLIKKWILRGLFMTQYRLRWLTSLFNQPLI